MNGLADVDRIGAHFESLSWSKVASYAGGVFVAERADALARPPGYRKWPCVPGQVRASSEMRSVALRFGFRQIGKWLGRSIDFDPFADRRCCLLFSEVVFAGTV
jgi:hypothetical protein